MNSAVTPPNLFGNLLRAPFLFALTAMAGCVSGPADSSPDRHRPDLAAVYERQQLRFTQATFQKPREPATNSTADLAFTLAPLFIWEHPTGHTNTPSVPAIVFWSLGSSGDPTRANPQITYYWGVPTTSAFWAASGYQAIRITLDSTGRPVLWQVLHDPSGASLFFVAQSLESAARSRIGPPFEGRRHSTEPSLNSAPQTIVARVIEDGPVPMGPVLYVQKDLSVGTLICRCMPAQAGDLMATRTYQLEPAPAESYQLIDALFSKARGAQPACPPLRLPETF